MTGGETTRREGARGTAALGDLHGLEGERRERERESLTWLSEKIERSNIVGRRETESFRVYVSK